MQSSTALVLDPDIHPIYAVVCAVFKSKGYTSSGAGTTLSVALGNDTHIETFIYSAKNVRVYGIGSDGYESRDSLGSYMSGYAFSIELRVRLDTFSPVYGQVLDFNDPESFAKTFFAVLADLLDGIPSQKFLMSSLAGVLTP